MPSALREQYEALQRAGATIASPTSAAATQPLAEAAQAGSVRALVEAQAKANRLLARFDLNQKPMPRPMLIQHVGPERGLLGLAGDTGSCKSITSLDLARAVVQQDRWLGYKVNRSGPVVIFDAENDPDFDVLTRIDALQPPLSDAEKRQIHFFPAQGLGGTKLERWAAEVDHYLDEAKPVLAILDAFFSAGPGIETGNNDAVTPFMRLLKQLAMKHGCLIVVIHHHKKPQQGAPRAAKYQASGAQQFINQVNNHLALSVLEQTATPQDDGSRKLRTVIRVEDAKQRSSIGDSKIAVSVDSIEDAPDPHGNRALRDLTVRRLDADEAVPLMSGAYGRVLRALREALPAELRRAELIAKTELSPSSVDNATAKGLAASPPTIEQPRGKGAPYRAVVVEPAI